MSKLTLLILVFSIFACKPNVQDDLTSVRCVEILDELETDEFMNSLAYTEVYPKHYQMQKLQLDSIDQAYIRVNGIYKNIIEIGYKENCDNYFNELNDFLKMAIQMSKKLDPVANTTKRLHLQINRLNNLIMEPNQIESSIHLIQVEINYCTILLCRAIIP